MAADAVELSFESRAFLKGEGIDEVDVLCDVSRLIRTVTEESTRDACRLVSNDQGFDQGELTMHRRSGRTDSHHLLLLN